MAEDFQADIDAVARIASVPKILDVMRRATGMGFAAVARVTSERWIACEVQDSIAFGLRRGGELQIDYHLPPDPPERGAGDHQPCGGG